MKNTKLVVLILMMMALVVCLCSCGGGNGNENSAVQATTQPTATVAPTAAPPA